MCQTCSRGHKMNNILWQTLGAFDLVYSSYKWIPAMLLCGKHSTTMQIWIVSRLWFCRRHGRLKINIRWTFVFFGSHTFAPISWMCKKKTSVSHSSTEAGIISLDARLRYSRSHSLRFGDWIISFRTEQNRWTQERATEKPVGNCQAKRT